MDDMTFNLSPMRCFFIIFFSLTIHHSASAQDTTEVKMFWDKFIHALKNKDTTLIKELSLPKINCDVCLGNGPDKTAELEKKIRETPDWYEKLNTDWVYIPIDSFIKNDLNSFLASEFIDQTSVHKYIFQPEPVHLEQEVPSHIRSYLVSDKNYFFYKILLTSPPLEANEGNRKQYSPVIRVLQTEKGLKFYGFWTIP